MLNFTRFLYTKGFQNSNTNFNGREKFRNLIFDNSGKRYECSLKFQNGNNWKIPFHWFKAVGPWLSYIIYFDISMKHVDVIGRLKISSIFSSLFRHTNFINRPFFLPCEKRSLFLSYFLQLSPLAFLDKKLSTFYLHLDNTERKSYWTS